MSIGKHGMNEGNLRFAFSVLLNGMAKINNLVLINEHSFKNKKGKLIRPDGTIKNSMGIDFGYWESKDHKDDIHKEIENKFNIGYPTENILFENGRTAILYQEGDKIIEIENIEEEEGKFCGVIR